VTLVSRDSPSLKSAGLEEGEENARVFGMVYELDPESEAEVSKAFFFRFLLPSPLYAYVSQQHYLSGISFNSKLSKTFFIMHVL